MPYDSTDISEHYKQRGEWAELLFMAHAAQHGLTIVRPWGDSSPYDVALVCPEKCPSRPSILRIQIKSTQCLHSRGGYKCHIDSNGVPYREGMLDFIAAFVIPEQVWFIIPFEATRRRPRKTRVSRPGQASACSTRRPQTPRCSPDEVVSGVRDERGFRSLGWQNEILLAPNRPKSKYAKYKEAWHLLRPAPTRNHPCPLAPGEVCPIARK
jgi:hypothetical protein